MSSPRLLLLIASAVSVVAEIAEMEFTKWPESVTAPVGDEVTFECTVRVPGERLAWRWKSVDPAGSWVDLPGGGNEKVSSRLIVKVKEGMQPAFYQCVVWYGAVSLASVPGRLAVARIDLDGYVGEKRVLTAPLKNNLALHCRPPASDPPAVISWWKEDKGKRKQLDTPHGVLTISNASTEDSGVYGCTATNELSGQSVELPGRTVLKVQHEGRGGIRFLESEAYASVVDSSGTPTAPVPPSEGLRLWCGLVGTPQPTVTWSRDVGPLPGRARTEGGLLFIAPFRAEDEGVYTCSAGGKHRSWRVYLLEAAHWEGTAGSVNGTEGGGARVSCGTPLGAPTPEVYWLLNAVPVNGDRSIKTTESELHIEHVEKRHAGIVQCFACNELGCAYDAALLTVMPVQISDQEYSAESVKNVHIPPQPPKRHVRKNQKKRKDAVLIPPSRPNVTRMSDESVMLSWSNGTQGLAIQFFKVQYREVGNGSSAQWLTESNNIPPYVHCYEVAGLKPNRYYKFRIAAVYSNQDNNLGKATSKFHLRRGAFRGPRAPVLTSATPLTPKSILLNWTWSSEDDGVPAEGFYIHYRDVSSAGEYEKVAVEATARSLVLAHLMADTAYEAKIQAFTQHAPSDFTSILKAKTLRATPQASTTEKPPGGGESAERGASGALATAGGAAAVVATLLVVGILLCRRARRLHHNAEYKEKGSVPEGGVGGNGYIPAKVPITITSNPMHAEQNGDSGVELSYMHNNNTGGGDAAPLARKNGTAPRQYV